VSDDGGARVRDAIGAWDRALFSPAGAAPGRMPST
jgi:hypothetical protein